MKLRTYFVIPALVALVHCGTASFSTSGGNDAAPGTDASKDTRGSGSGSTRDAGQRPDVAGGSGSGSAGSGSGSSGSGSGTSSGSGSGTSSGSGSGSSSGSGSGEKPDASACPDETGVFTITISASNGSCGTLAPSTRVCISETACNIDLTAKGALASFGLSGMTSIASDGSFQNATIQEGTSQRTGCTGSWDANARTLTIDCGGTNTTQSCVVVLTRIGSGCP